MAQIEKAGGLVVRDAHKVWRVGPAPEHADSLKNQFEQNLLPLISAKSSRLQPHPHQVDIKTGFQKFQHAQRIARHWCDSSGMTESGLVLGMNHLGINSLEGNRLPLEHPLFGVVFEGNQKDHPNLFCGVP